jgi:hypothetical protein
VSADDQQIQRWLGWLHDGSEADKLVARRRLAGVFEQRGMLEEAIELLGRNVRACATPRPFAGCLDSTRPGMTRRGARRPQSQRPSTSWCRLRPSSQEPLRYWLSRRGPGRSVTWRRIS